MKKLLLITSLIFALYSCKSTKEQKPEASATEQSMEMTKERIEERDQQLRAMGTDFVAFGNEPNWIVRIDLAQHKVDLELMGEGDIHFSLEDQEYVNIHEFTANNGTNTLEFMARETDCYDNMSGEHFPYQVSFVLDGKSYRGCGKNIRKDKEINVIPSQLNDIWALESVAGLEYDRENTKGEQPVLEIHLTEQRVSGNSGCNHFQGSVEIEENKIHFGPMAMTRKYCEGSMESEFMAALEQVDSYKIEKMKLYLMDKNGKEILRFRKVD